MTPHLEAYKSAYLASDQFAGTVVEVTQLVRRRFPGAAPPELISEGSNVTLGFRDVGLCAKVATSKVPVRPTPASFDRDIRIARRLRSVGLAVVSPAVACPAGAHRLQLGYASLWELHVHKDHVDVPAAVRRLQACHDELASVQPAPGDDHHPLVEAAGILARLPATNYLDQAEADLLQRATERVTSEMAALEVPTQLVHGDAYLGNVLPTPSGGIWCDWEDAFVAPIEWDLACLIVPGMLHGQSSPPAEAIIEVYGRPVDAKALAVTTMGRVLQCAAWSAYFNRPVAGSRARRRSRLDWLRARLEDRTMRLGRRSAAPTQPIR